MLTLNSWPNANSQLLHCTQLELSLTFGKNNRDQRMLNNLSSRFQWPTSNLQVASWTFSITAQAFLSYTPTTIRIRLLYEVLLSETKTATESDEDTTYHIHIKSKVLPRGETKNVFKSEPNQDTQNALNNWQTCILVNLVRDKLRSGLLNDWALLCTL